MVGVRSFCFVLRQINQHLVTIQGNEPPQQPTSVSGEVSLVAGRKPQKQEEAGEAVRLLDRPEAEPAAPV